MELDRRARDRDREVRIEGLKRERARLEAEQSTTAAAIERLEQEVERRRVRAPVAGRLGEVADRRVGSVVEERDRLGAVVPPGALRVQADFHPADGLGRIRPGQPGRLRLEGFPWTQYGTVPATVAGLAAEVTDGRLRVELDLGPDTGFPVPLQHGLPGTVEVEVERATPAALVLRAAGRALSGRAGSR
jgi:membrane fusion protein (multidrug efflux system)